MKNEMGMILSIPQLRLCMHTLIDSCWDDLPLLDTEEPLEQRLLNAFLQLIKLEYFLPEADGYVPDPDFRKVIQLIGQADCKYRLYKDNMIAAFIYEKGNALAVVTPDAGRAEYCQINCYTGVAVEEIKNQFEAPEKLRLQQVAAVVEMGQYDMQSLALFFGERRETEEAE